MTLREKIKNREFVVTVEVEPPKGVSIDSIIDGLKRIKDKVDAFNVTDMQSSMMKMSSWAMCARLKQEGLEPILQMTTRDRNVIALQGDLLGSFVLGIENVLVLTGDSPQWGDHPQAKAVFELDSVKLIQTISGLNSGIDFMGNALKGATNFFTGAALSPCASDREKEFKKMQEKINAGVAFFQTQPVFEVEKFSDFFKQAHTNIPVIAGIIFLKSPKMARYLNENIPGVHVPDYFIERLEKASSYKEEAKKIAVEIIAELKGKCSGVHIMPFGWYKEVQEIL